MKLSASFFITIIISLGILLLSQVFFLALGFSTYSDFQKSGHISVNTVASNFAAEKFTLVNRFGREIQRYPKTDGILQNLFNITHSKSIIVCDEKGDIIVKKGESEVSVINLSLIEHGQYKVGNDLYVASPYYDRNDTVKGYVLSSLTREKAYSYLDRSNFQFKDIYLKVLGIFAISTCCFLFFFINELKKIQRKVTTSFSKFKTFILPFCIAQILALILVIPFLSVEFNQTVKNIELNTATSIKNEINSIINLGITFDDISSMDTYLLKLKDELPLVGSLRIENLQHELIAGDDIAQNDGMRLPIISDYGTIAFIAAKIDPNAILNLTFKLVIDMATIIIVSFIMLNELSTLIHSEISHHNLNSLKLCDPLLIRPIAFLAILAAYMPFSILPLYMSELVHDFLGLSQNIIMSLPISTDVAATMVSTLMVLLFSRRLGGWRPLIKIGFISIAIAMFIAYFALNPVVFLISRVFYGLGYGAVLLSFDMYIIKNAHIKERGKYMANMCSGLFAGTICGCALGGFIADNFGNSIVFISSFIILLLTIFIVFYITNTRTDAIFNNKTQDKQFKLSKIGTFILNREVLGLFLFQVLPYGALAVGVFNYFLPVSMHENGFGATTIGQLNMIYALCVILMSPLFGKILDKSHQKFMILGLGLAFSALAPLMFAYIPGIYAAICAITLLGLSAAINESGQITYISGLKVAKGIGENEAVTILDIFVRIGQMIGPMLIALSLTLFNQNAFVYISVIAFIIGFIFILTQLKTTKEHLRT